MELMVVAFNPCPESQLFIGIKRIMIFIKKTRLLTHTHTHIRCFIPFVSYGSNYTITNHWTTRAMLVLGEPLATLATNMS